MKQWIFAVGICSAAFGCSWFANSRPSVEPGYFCWDFPGYGKVCAETAAKLAALKVTLSPDAGAP
jgi:hypothetical protein